MPHPKYVIALDEPCSNLNYANMVISYFSKYKQAATLNNLCEEFWNETTNVKIITTKGK